MKKLIFCLSIITSLHAQGTADWAGPTVGGPYLVQGFVLSSLNSSGFTKLINHQVNNVTAINPAAINQFKQTTFGVSYQFESDIKPARISDIRHTHNQILKPQSAAIVVADGDFTYGVSFNQRYNSYIDFGKMEVTTVQNPDGTGEFFSASDENIVDSYSGVVSYSFQDKLVGLVLGARIGLSVLNFESKIWHIEASKTGTLLMQLLDLLIR